MNYLGIYLKKKLKEMEVSEREVSARCGISHSYLNQLIRGINPRTNKPISPTISTLEKLSIGLDVPIDFLQKVARGMHEFDAILGTRLEMAKFDEVEKCSRSEGIVVGTKKDRIIPWELWKQIKEAQTFLSCLGLDPSEHTSEEWLDIIEDFKLVIKLHEKKRKK